MNLKALKAVAILMLAPAAFAATATSKVTLTVLPDCGISATDIDMGVYNPSTGASGSGTVRVRCNAGTIDLVLGGPPTASQQLLSTDVGNLRQTVLRSLTGPGSNNTIPYTAVFQSPPAVNGIWPFRFSGVSVTGIGSIGFIGGSNRLLENVDLPVQVSVESGLFKLAGVYTDTIHYALTFSL